MKISYMLANPVLYVVRHGSTGDDESYNSPENDSLNEDGKKQAREAADFLSGRHVGGIITSRLNRAHETASIVGKKLGLEPEIDDRIDSLDVGDVKDMASQEEADRIIDHHVANPHEVIPGGESIQDFRDDTHPAFKDALRMSRERKAPMIMVTHHSVEHEVGNFFNDKSTSALTHPGGVVEVLNTGKGLVAVPVFKPDHGD